MYRLGSTGNFQRIPGVRVLVPADGGCAGGRCVRDHGRGRVCGDRGVSKHDTDVTIETRAVILQQV